MAVVSTGRTIRDGVRMRLGLSTALEAGDAIGDPMAFGGSGRPHPNQPEPTDRRIDLARDETISDINIRARLGGADQPVSIAIPAQTANGPYRVDLRTGFSPRESQINEVKRVWWNDGSANTVLRWTHYRDMDANHIDFTSQAVGKPEYCWYNNYGLFILPAPSSAGTLYAYIGKGLIGPATEDDTIEQLPADLMWVIEVGAAWRICADQPYDAVMRDRAAILGPLYERGVNDIKTTLGSFGQYSPRIIPLTYRTRRTSR